MDIRRAGRGDIEELVALRLELLAAVGSIQAGDDVAGLENVTRTYLRDKLDRGFVCWLAEDGPRPVGAIGLVLFERPPVIRNLSGVEGYILSVYVRPGHRRQGLASLLVGAAVAYARTAGVRRIWLHATGEGRGVYERLGFRPRDNEMELTW